MESLKEWMKAVSLGASWAAKKAAERVAERVGLLVEWKEYFVAARLVAWKAAKTEATRAWLSWGKEWGIWWARE